MITRCLIQKVGDDKYEFAVATQSQRGMYDIINILHASLYKFASIATVNFTCIGTIAIPVSLSSIL